MRTSKILSTLSSPHVQDSPIVMTAFSRSPTDAQIKGRKIQQEELLVKDHHESLNIKRFPQIIESFDKKQQARTSTKFQSREPQLNDEETLSQASNFNNDQLGNNNNIFGNQNQTEIVVGLAKEKKKIISIINSPQQNNYLSPKSGNTGGIGVAVGGGLDNGKGQRGQRDKKTKELSEQIQKIAKCIDAVNDLQKDQMKTGKVRKGSSKRRAAGPGNSQNNQNSKISKKLANSGISSKKNGKPTTNDMAKSSVEAEVNDEFSQQTSSQQQQFKSQPQTLFTQQQQQEYFSQQQQQQHSQQLRPMKTAYQSPQLMQSPITKKTKLQSTEKDLKKKVSRSQQQYQSNRSLLTTNGKRQSHQQQQQNSTSESLSNSYKALSHSLKSTSVKKKNKRSINAQKLSSEKEQEEEKLQMHQQQRAMITAGSQAVVGDENIIVVDETEAEEREMEMQRIIKENLRKLQMEKLRKKNELNQQQEQKLNKLEKLNNLNDKIRNLNQNRFFKKKDQDIDHRLPWGANQERLKNYAINVIQKLYKSSIDQEKLDQQPQQQQQFVEQQLENQEDQINQEQLRRQRIGCEFLNQLNDRDYEELLTRSKQVQSNNSQFISQEQAHNKNSAEMQDSEVQENLKLYMEYKKRQIEEQHYQEVLNKLNQKQKVVENMENLKDNIQLIFDRQQKRKKKKKRAANTNAKANGVNTQGLVNGQGNSQGIGQGTGQGSSNFNSDNNLKYSQKLSDVRQKQMGQVNGINQEERKFDPRDIIANQEYNQYQQQQGYGNSDGSKNSNLLQSPTAMQTEPAMKTNSSRNTKNYMKTDNDEPSSEQDYSQLYDEYKKIMNDAMQRSLQSPSSATATLDKKQLVQQMQLSGGVSGVTGGNNPVQVTEFTTKKSKGKKKKKGAHQHQQQQKPGHKEETGASGGKGASDEQQQNQMEEQDTRNSRLDQVNQVKQQFDKISKRYIQMKDQQKIQTSSSPGRLPGTQHSNHGGENNILQGLGIQQQSGSSSFGKTNNANKKNSRLLVDEKVEEKVESEDNTSRGLSQQQTINNLNPALDNINTGPNISQGQNSSNNKRCKNSDSDVVVGIPGSSSEPRNVADNELANNSCGGNSFNKSKTKPQHRLSDQMAVPQQQQQVFQNDFDQQFTEQGEHSKILQQQILIKQQQFQEGRYDNDEGDEASFKQHMLTQNPPEQQQLFEDDQDMELINQNKQLQIMQNNMKSQSPQQQHLRDSEQFMMYMQGNPNRFPQQQETIQQQMDKDDQDSMILKEGNDDVSDPIPDQQSDDLIAKEELKPPRDIFYNNKSNNSAGGGNVNINGAKPMLPQPLQTQQQQQQAGSQQQQQQGVPSQLCFNKPFSNDQSEFERMQEQINMMQRNDKHVQMHSDCMNDQQNTSPSAQNLQDDEEEIQFLQHNRQQQLNPQDPPLRFNENGEIDENGEFNEEELQQIAEQIFNNAATFIQKIWRGYYTRKVLAYYLDMLERGEIEAFEEDNNDQDAIMQQQYQQQQQQQQHQQIVTFGQQGSKEQQEPLTKLQQFQQQQQQFSGQGKNQMDFQLRSKSFEAQHNVYEVEEDDDEEEDDNEIQPQNNKKFQQVLAGQQIIASGNSKVVQESGAQVIKQQQIEEDNTGIGGSISCTQQNNQKTEEENKKLDRAWFENQDKEEIDINFCGETNNNEKFIHISTIKSSQISNNNEEHSQRDSQSARTLQLQGNAQAPNTGGSRPDVLKPGSKPPIQDLLLEEQLNQQQSQLQTQQQQLTESPMLAPTSPISLQGAVNQEFKSDNINSGVVQGSAGVHGIAQSQLKQLRQEEIRRWKEMLVQIKQMKQSDPSSKSSLLKTLKDLIQQNITRLLESSSDPQESGEYDDQGLLAEIDNILSHSNAVEENNNSNSGMNTVLENLLIKTKKGFEPVGEQIGAIVRVTGGTKVISAGQHEKQPQIAVEQKHHYPGEDLEDSKEDNYSQQCCGLSQNKHQQQQLGSQKTLNNDSLSHNSSQQKTKPREMDLIERYDIRCERSFNEARRNRFNSPHLDLSSSSQPVPLDQRLLSEPEQFHSAGGHHEINQLYLLLSSEQVTRDKKFLNSRSLGSNCSSNKNSARANVVVGGVSASSQQQFQQLPGAGNAKIMFQEYFETSNCSGEQQQQTQPPVQNSSSQMNMNIFEKDPFKEFTERKLRELMMKENMQQILDMRAKALEMRMKTQEDIWKKQLKENNVSPRTYESKRIELEQWARQEQEDLLNTQKELERGWQRAMDSMQRTQRDIEFYQRFNRTGAQQQFTSNSSVSNGSFTNNVNNWKSSSIQEDEYFSNKGGSLSGRHLQQPLANSASKSESDSAISDQQHVHQSGSNNSSGNGSSEKKESHSNIKIIDKFEIAGSREQTLDPNQQQQQEIEEEIYLTQMPLSQNSLSQSQNYVQSSQSPITDLQSLRLNSIQTTESKIDDTFKFNSGEYKSFPVQPQLHSNHMQQQDCNQSGSLSLSTNSLRQVKIAPDADLRLVLEQQDFCSGNQPPQLGKQQQQYQQQQQYAQLQLEDNSLSNNSSSLKKSCGGLSSSTDSQNMIVQQLAIERYSNEKLMLKKKDELMKNKKPANSRYCDEYYSTSPETDARARMMQEARDAKDKLIKSTSSERSDGGAGSSSIDREKELNEFDDELGQKKYNDAQMMQALSHQQCNTFDQPQQQLSQFHCNEQVSEPNQQQQQQMLQPVAANPISEMYQEYNDEMQERWRVLQIIDQRIKEQLERQFALDKSENYGIPTNIYVFTNYIDNLCLYVREHYLNELIDNLNTPFGFSPSKRLKLIHGYDSFVENIEQSQAQDDFQTLPFVLSEDLFIEFEQNFIGSGEEEKEQIIKEFEHIHNKSIFDSFNEALNLFRPFYSLGGPPYSWSKSEKNLILGKANKDNIIFIQEKSKQKVLEWANLLCGFIVDNENNPNSSSTNDSEEQQQQKAQPRQIQYDPNRPLASLIENMPPEHECIAQIREEKLSKMLLQEIFENEYKWQLYEDEKAEVVMELADLVFEDLVDELVSETDKINQH